MTDKTMITKPIAAAVGVAFVSSIAISSTAVAADNPFAMADLDSGYMLAGHHEGEEGKCGEKGEEGKCGEKGEEALAVRRARKEAAARKVRKAPAVKRARKASAAKASAAVTRTDRGGLPQQHL